MSKYLQKLTGYIYLQNYLRGHPELSTFFIYDITSHRRERESHSPISHYIFESVINVGCLLRGGRKLFEKL